MCTETLHDLLFGSSSNSAIRTQSPEDQMHQQLEHAVKAQSGSYSVVADIATVLEFVATSLTHALRQLNAALRARLWPSQAANRLPLLLLSAAKAKTTARGKQARDASSTPMSAADVRQGESRVVRVELRRCASSDAPRSDSHELLVPGEWNAFVHEAARACALLNARHNNNNNSDATEVVRVFSRHGARVSALCELTHDDVLYIGAPNEPFSRPDADDDDDDDGDNDERVIEEADVEAERRALREMAGPRRSRGNDVWLAALHGVDEQRSEAQRERARKWSEYEPLVLVISTAFPVRSKRKKIDFRV